MTEYLRQRTNLNELTPVSARYDTKQTQSEAQQSPWVKHMKVIKFTGNMKENIAELLTGIDCRCGFKKDYSQIINAYGDKIMRLREDRAKYKENSTQEKLRNQVLQEQLKKANKELRALQQNFTALTENTIPKTQHQSLLNAYQTLQQLLASSQNSLSQAQLQTKKLQQQLLTRNVFAMSDVRQVRRSEPDQMAEDSNLLDSITEGQREGEILRQENELLRLRLREYQRIEGELGIGAEEMTNILRDYLSEMPMFTTKEERDLFLLAKKMNHNLWNRKLEIEIKDLQQRKEQLRKLEQELKRKAT